MLQRMRSLGRRPFPLALAAVALAGIPSAAQAASVAYVDNGEIWVSSLDGAQKVRIGEQFTFQSDSGPVTQKYLDVAAADGGRIIGVRNEPGKIAQLSRFRIWEPDGKVVTDGSGQQRDGALGHQGGSGSYAYPLSLDLTPDGGLITYGYSRFTPSSGPGFPSSLDEGYYVQPAANLSGGTPLVVSGRTWPSLFGKRALALTGDTDIVLQKDTSAAPVGDDFDSFLGVMAPAGEEITRSDIAANGSVIAIKRQNTSGSLTQGAIDVLPISVFGPPATGDFAAGCTLPSTGRADQASISQDGTRIAWADEGGVKVAPIPTFTGANDCQFSSPPIVISPTGSKPSIGPANVVDMLPPAPVPTPTPTPTPTATPGPGAGTGGGGGAGTGTGGAATAPTAAVPSAGFSAAALTAAKGLGVRLTVRRAGKVTLRLTVPAKTLGRRGKAILIATGSANPTKAGTITVTLKRTKAARGKAKRLRRARATLSITQAGRTTTRTVRLR